MTKRYLLFLTWLAVAALTSAALAQQVGPEFQVNTYTTANQLFPAVASDATGNFVVVWSGAGTGDSYGASSQRYDSGGNQLGGEFQVNTYTMSAQVLPSVASAASCNFVVVWASYYQDNDSVGVFGQRYDSGGNPLGNEFQVNSYTTSYQTRPAVASDATGNFIVVWESYGQDGSGWGVFGQRYDSRGNPLDGEFQVNTYTTGYQSAPSVGHPSVASDATGNFIVVWESYGQDGGKWGAFGQRYDSSGNPLGGEFQINTYTTNLQRIPSVASDASGNFVVVWESYYQDGYGYGIFGQRYDSDGNPLGTEFPVNTYRPGVQKFPSVSSDSAGNFVVVWASQQDGSLYGVFGQRYDSRGNPLGGEFQINTYTTDYQDIPAITSDANGQFVVVWRSTMQDGSGDGVFGQRFSAACEASLQIKGGVHTPGGSLPVEVHIAHHRPKTVTVPWELSLIDANGQVIAKHTTAPHTFEPGDVVDRNVEFRLPDDLAVGTYTLELAISGMAGTKGATTSLRVVRAE